MNRTLIAAAGVAVCAIAGVVGASPTAAQEPLDDSAGTIEEIDLAGFEQFEEYMDAVASEPAPATDVPAAALPPAAPIEPAADVVDAPPSVEATGGVVALPAAGHGDDSGGGVSGLVAVAILVGGAASVAGGVARGRGRASS